MNRVPTPCAARGFALLVCLLLLVGASLVGAGMLRSATLQERIAGQVRDKQRAFEAAQSALRFGENWLQASGPVTGGACVGVGDAATLRVCSSPLGPAGCRTTAAGSRADPAAWPARFDFSPQALASGSGGGLAPSGDIVYAARPGLYIEDAGSSADGRGRVYCVTGYGFGGSMDTLAVVRSIYILQSSVRSLDPGEP